MNILRAFVVLAAVAVAGSAHAADVCRLAKTATDRVEGTSSLTMSKYGLSFAIQDGVGTVSMPVSVGGLNGAGVPAGTELLMVLENGTRITFFTNQDVRPTGTAYATQYSAGVYSTWRLTWGLSPEAAHAIAQSPPVAMRYKLGATEFKPDYDTGVGRRLQMLFACAANNITGS